MFMVVMLMMMTTGATMLVQPQDTSSSNGNPCRPLLRCPCTPHHSLTGTIPRVVSDASYLQSLTLSNNQLTGGLGDEVGTNFCLVCLERVPC